MGFMPEPLLPSPRADLFVTTALKPDAPLVARAQGFAAELGAPYLERRDNGLPKLFAAAAPGAERALVVQRDRLVLTDRSGHEFFYHPNMAFLRLGNLQRGQPDSLINAAGLREGDAVLDATLGYAAEAILCAYTVGESGTVHGIEAVPELGVVVREGLKTVTTDRAELNAAMRRVEVTWGTTSIICAPVPTAATTWSASTRSSRSRRRAPRHSPPSASSATTARSCPSRLRRPAGSRGGG